LRTSKRSQVRAGKPTRQPKQGKAGMLLCKLRLRILVTGEEHHPSPHQTSSNSSIRARHRARSGVDPQNLPARCVWTLVTPCSDQDRAMVSAARRGMLRYSTRSRTAHPPRSAACSLQSTLHTPHSPPSSLLPPPSSHVLSLALPGPAVTYYLYLLSHTSCSSSCSLPFSTLIMPSPDSLRSNSTPLR
jgi:hypothetical protein